MHLPRLTVWRISAGVSGTRISTRTALLASDKAMNSTMKRAKTISHHLVGLSSQSVERIRNRNFDEETSKILTKDMASCALKGCTLGSTVFKLFGLIGPNCYVQKLTFWCLLSVSQLCTRS